MTIKKALNEKEVTNDLVEDFVAKLKQVRMDIWSNMPTEVSNLTSRRGVVQPAGTIIYIEADTRILHELLWELRLMAYENNGNIGYLIKFTCGIIQYFRKKLEELYSLTNSANLMKNVEILLAKCKNCEEYLKLINELILYVGRINMWIDLLIPWYHINETFQKNFQTL